MAEIEEESRAIRQADYDAYFKDLMDSEGLNVDEAAEQVIESISSQYDVHNLFMYKNKRELDEKMKVESRCVTIEKAGKGTDSFINANFAFQGLVKILKDSDASVREGIWHMFESRKLLRSLIQLMVVKEEAEDDNKKVLGEVDSDSDEEDEDEANILQTLAVLDFSMAIVQSAKLSRQYFHDFELFFTLDETLVEILRRRLDEDIADPRYNITTTKLICMIENLF